MAKVQSGVWTGKRVMGLMFGKSQTVTSGSSPKKAVKKATKTTQTTKGESKMPYKKATQAKSTNKPVKIGSYRDFVSKKFKEGERDFKVIGKEWQKAKGGEDDAAKN